jgi:hypothetical protein
MVAAKLSRKAANDMVRQGPLRDHDRVAAIAAKIPLVTSMAKVMSVMSELHDK